MTSLPQLDLTEHCLSSQTLVTGGLLTVKCDEVRLPNGQHSQREYVVHPGAVLIIPILPNGDVILERQFRYPLRQVFIELPAGKIDTHEDPLQTGQRELLEETGYTAKHWVKLGAQHPCIGYSDEVIHMYIATDLAAGPHLRDADETLEVFTASFTDCIAMVMRGEISDGKTIIALLMAEKFMQSALAQTGP